MEILQQLAERLEKGDHTTVAALTQQAVDAGLEPRSILDRGLVQGMSVVGEKFRLRKIFLPDVLLAAKAMYAGMDLLKPLLIKQGIESVGKVVLGTVQDDMHDIGKNLVGIMLRSAGFHVIDLGYDVAPEAFIEAAEREKADVIGMSALLTTTMPVMKKVVDLADARQLRGRTKIIVGGAPLSAEYAQEIGADAYCYDGVSAVECVRRYVRRST